MEQIVQHEFSEHSHPYTVYCSRFSDLQYTHTRSKSWSTDITPEDLFEKTKATMFTSRLVEGWVACAVELDAGLAYISINGGTVQVNTSATTSEKAQDLLVQVREWIPLVEEDEKPEEVSVKFWTLGERGPQAHRRRIVVPEWPEIEGNYNHAVQKGLNHLMSLESGKSLEDGQLLLWQGPPGTGKTYALRALTRAWTPWCEFNYIVDPERFFGSSADYMMQVILSGGQEYDPFEEDGEKERWQLLILEDSGELLASDAKQQVGQALSRLLNVVDGMIGQGLRLLVLVTTNEEIKKLHPAVSRHGRCAQQLSFNALSKAEREKWCEINEISEPSAYTLADLFAEKRGQNNGSNGRVPVGFAER